MLLNCYSLKRVTLRSGKKKRKKKKELLSEQYSRPRHWCFHQNDMSSNGTNWVWLTCPSSGGTLIQQIVPVCVGV